MSRTQVTHDEFQEILKAQGHKDSYDCTLMCPACYTLQTGNDLMAALKTEDREKVRGYVGFSCIGRFNNKDTGCDWTLGGLFKIHDLEVLHEHNGEEVTSPVFEPVTPSELAEKIKSWRKEAYSIKEQLKYQHTESEDEQAEKKMIGLIAKADKAEVNNHHLLEGESTRQHGR